MSKIQKVFLEESDIPIEHVILVAHNGKRFDIPFLFAPFEVNEIKVPSFMSHFSIDMMLLVSHSIIASPRLDIPLNCKL